MLNVNKSWILLCHLCRYETSFSRILRLKISRIFFFLLWNFPGFFFSFEFHGFVIFLVSGFFPHSVFMIFQCYKNLPDFFLLWNFPGFFLVSNFTDLLFLVFRICYFFSFRFFFSVFMIFRCYKNLPDFFLVSNLPDFFSFEFHGFVIF